MINKISFCILSNELAPNKSLNSLVHSIINQNIPDYEILIAYSEGEIVKNTKYKNILYFPVKKMSSMVNHNKKLEQHKKRQIMTSHAKYENIIFLKDYHILHENWYYQIKNFPSETKVIVGKIQFSNGERYLDRCCGNFKHANYDYRKGILIDYKLTDNNQLKKLDMYVSGAVFLSKKKLFQKLFKKFKDNEFIKDYDICKFIFSRIDYKITLSESLIISKKQNLTPKYKNRNRLIQNLNEILC